MLNPTDTESQGSQGDESRLQFECFSASSPKKEELDTTKVVSQEAM